MTQGKKIRTSTGLEHGISKFIQPTHLTVIILAVLVTSISGYDTTCPIGCYDCVVDTPKSFEKLRKSMPPSVRRVMRR